MRCEHVETLIPLYVGGDLEPHEADSLRQHLISCAHCRQLHEEFQASHSWLTGFAVPAFDEASFAKLRASVLKEIGRQEKRGSWSGWIDWLLPKWSPRLMLATAAVALAVTTGLVAAVYRQQVAPARAVGETIADAGQIKPATGTEHTNPLPQELNRVATAPRSVPRSKHVKAATPLLPPEALGNGGSLNPLEPPVIPEEESATESVAQVEPEPKEMLRIELQTADPNIRIIWLTPKPDSPSNPKTK
ncbi:MAG: zf-HC2 domain-containing protein [Acidobacteria bacterium]|nr:zf-HC2 domain-containing protein [Acidobacteriota bacterium]